MVEEESQIWVSCSPFIQFSLWFKQGEGRKKKRFKLQEIKVWEFGTLIFVSMEISHLMYGKYGNPSLSRFG